MASPRELEPLFDPLEPTEFPGVNGSEGCSPASCGKRIRLNELGARDAAVSPTV